MHTGFTVEVARLRVTPASFSTAQRPEALVQWVNGAIANVDPALHRLLSLSFQIVYDPGREEGEEDWYQRRDEVWAVIDYAVLAPERTPIRKTQRKTEEDRQYEAAFAEAAYCMRALAQAERNLHRLLLLRGRTANPGKLKALILSARNRRRAIKGILKRVMSGE